MGVCFPFSFHLWVDVIISGSYKCCLGKQTAVKIHSEKKDLRMLRNASPRSSSFLLLPFSLSSSLLMLSFVVLTDTAPISSKSNLNRKDILASFLRVAANINNITAVSKAFTGQELFEPRELYMTQFRFCH